MSATEAGTAVKAAVRVFHQLPLDDRVAVRRRLRNLGGAGARIA